MVISRYKIQPHRWKMDTDITSLTVFKPNQTNNYNIWGKQVTVKPLFTTRPKSTLFLQCVGSLLCHWLWKVTGKKNIRLFSMYTTTITGKAVSLHYSQAWNEHKYNHHSPSYCYPLITHPNKNSYRKRQNSKDQFRVTGKKKSGANKGLAFQAWQ